MLFALTLGMGGLQFRFGCYLTGIVRQRRSKNTALTKSFRENQYDAVLSIPYAVVVRRTFMHGEDVFACPPTRFQSEVQPHRNRGGSPHGDSNANPAVGAAASGNRCVYPKRA